MKLVTRKCPSCGAQVDLDGKTAVECDYCHSKVYVCYESAPTTAKPAQNPANSGMPSVSASQPLTSNRTSDCKPLGVVPTQTMQEAEQTESQKICYVDLTADRDYIPPPYVPPKKPKTFLEKILGD